MRRIAGLTALSTIAVLGACALWPERYAVNAPMLSLLFGVDAEAPETAALASRITLPEGFGISTFSADVPNARLLLFTDAGDLLVSSPREGKVFLLEADRDGDGRSDGRSTVLEDLRGPHGLDLHDGSLYVGEMHQVGRSRFDVATGRPSGAYETVVAELPMGGNHWTRTVRVGPDGALYVSAGSTCNVCEEKDPRRATLLRYRLDGSGEEIFASGLRNSVDFDWHPQTGELFATDNGRDLLGDDFPPCELNRIVRGGFYGWPHANGDRIPDPDFGAGEDERIRGSIPPVHGFRAHTAPLGMTFVRNPRAPAAYQGAALVALHGSWNRTRKDGYSVVSLHWRDDGSIEERDFAVGFERDGDVIGRPVDVAVGPDGAFYVSDDYAGAVYRIASLPRS